LRCRQRQLAPRRRARWASAPAPTVLLGDSSKQITLQPVSVEGSVGLNVAAGIAEVDLKYKK
jgi:hypothetical protein